MTHSKYCASFKKCPSNHSQSLDIPCPFPLPCDCKVIQKPLATPRKRIVNIGSKFNSINQTEACRTARNNRLQIEDYANEIDYWQKEYETNPRKGEYIKIKPKTAKKVVWSLIIIVVIGYLLSISLLK